MFLKKNTSLLGLLNDELKMNQIKVFLLCLKKGINLMFQTNINCYFKGRHSSSNFTNVLTYIFWISENIISKSVTSTNPMMRSYKYALCSIFTSLRQNSYSRVPNEQGRANDSP